MRKGAFKIIPVVLLLVIVVAVVFKGAFHKKATIEPMVSKQKLPTVETKLVLTLAKSIFMDFESRSSLETEYHVTAEKSFSGKRSIHIDEDTEYSDPFVAPIESIVRGNSLNKVVLRFKINSTSKLKQVRFVFAVGPREGKDEYWTAAELGKKSFKWNENICEFSALPESFRKGNLVKIYLWNVEKSDFYIDDLQIDFYELGKLHDEVSDQKQTNFSFDFEDGLDPHSTDDVAFEGMRSYKFGSDNEYGPVISKKASEYWNDTLRTVSISAMIYPLSDNPDIVLVSTVQDAAGKRLDWQGKSTKGLGFKRNEWKKLTAKFILPENAKAIDDVEVGAYVWNKGKGKGYIDNLEITMGDNKPRLGDREAVNMLTLEKGEYNAVRNKPPFTTSWLSKTEKIEDLSYRSESNELPQFPFRDVNSSCLFRSTDNSNRALTVNSDHKIDLLSYCENKKRFLYNGTFHNLILNEPDQLIAMNDEDVIVVQKSEGKLSLLNTGNLKSACDPCIGNSCPDYTFSSVNVNDFVSNLSQDFNAASGDLNGDGKDDLFLIDSKGNYSAIEFATGFKPNLLAKGNLPLKSTAKIVDLCLARIISKSGDDLFVIAKDNEGCSLAAFVFSDRKLHWQKYADNSINSFISGQSKLIKVRGKNSKDQLLLYNHNWRFDLKKLNLDQRGFYVESTVDFKGYEGNHNPKYYESTILFPYRRGKAEESLLIISRNCGDKNYNGSGCLNYENLDYLPNKIEVYDFY